MAILVILFYFRFPLHPTRSTTFNWKAYIMRRPGAGASHVPLAPEGPPLRGAEGGAASLQIHYCTPLPGASLLIIRASNTHVRVHTRSKAHTGMHAHTHACVRNTYSLTRACKHTSHVRIPSFTLNFTLLHTHTHIQRRTWTLSRPHVQSLWTFGCENVCVWRRHTLHASTDTHSHVHTSTETHSRIHTRWPAVELCWVGRNTSLIWEMNPEWSPGSHVYLPICIYAYWKYPCHSLNVPLWKPYIWNSKPAATSQERIICW